MKKLLDRKGLAPEELTAVQYKAVLQTGISKIGASMIKSQAAKSELELTAGKVNFVYEFRELDKAPEQSFGVWGRT